MELRHLRYFVAVAEELNFRRAAERLHVAAPTLSQQIKDLEASVGAQLLERDTTRVRLTAPGALFLVEVRRVLEAARQAAAVAREAAAGRRGTLRIGNAGALTHGFVPARVQAFLKQFPAVEVTLVELDLNTQAAAVAAGEIDIGFTLASGVGLPDGLRQHVVVRQPLRAVVGTDHPLARLRRVPLAAVARERLLAIGGSRSSSHGELIARVLGAAGHKHAPIKKVNGYEALLAMVASGQGVSLLMEMPSLGVVQGLTCRPLQETGPSIDFVARVIWRSEPSSPLPDQFIRVLLGRGATRG